MRLKTKLTLSITLLVLLVVVTANLVFLAGGIHQQLQDVNGRGDVLAHEVFDQLNEELLAAHSAGQLTPGAQGLQAFLLGRRESPALATLFTSAIASNGSIRDVALVAPDGTIAVDSNPLLEGQRQPARNLLSEVLGESPWRQWRTILGPEAIYDVSLAATVDGQALATIRVGIDTVLMRQAVEARMRQLALYGGLIVLLATGLAWALADLALQPLNAISAQLDQLVTGAGPRAAAPRDPRAPASPASAAAEDSGDAVGRVQTKIQRLGQQMADTREVYTALQENVSHVLEGLDEGLLLFDRQGQVVMTSTAVPRLLGASAGEARGRTVESLFGGESPLERTVRQGVREQTGFPMRELARQAGGRPLLARLDVVRDATGPTGALLTLRDPEPLSQLEHELEVARRLSAVGRLTRGVAHEVKNPLNAMAIHLNLLRAKAGAAGGPLQPHLQVLGREIERLDRAVRTFLDFSRPVELKLADGSLGELARGVAELMREPAAAQGIELVLSAPASGPRVWLDRDLIEQAVLNLVNNGIQAMQALPAGSPRQLRLEVFTSGRQALLRVRDQGAGIAAEHRDQIFDLYFTTREGGSGIGLALAARIMQLHHGAIELEPEQPGEPGASFLLRFPLRAEEAE